MNITWKTYASYILKMQKMELPGFMGHLQKLIAFRLQIKSQQIP